MAKVAQVKDIREHAKTASLQAVAGASALSVVTSARTLAEAGLALEHDGDLGGALYKYSQAANLLEYVLGTTEYKRETPKGQRGVLYQQTTKLSEYITGEMLPRAKKIEERLRALERSQPPSSPAAEPDARPMGSVADRMRMLAQAGMDVGSGAAPQQKPAKPAKPASSTSSDPPSRTIPNDVPPKVVPPKSEAASRPISDPPPLDAGLNPSSLNPGSSAVGGGTSSIQYDLAFLNDLTTGEGNNRGTPAVNGASPVSASTRFPPLTPLTPSGPSHGTPQAPTFSPPAAPPPLLSSPPGMFSSALNPSPTSNSSITGMFGISPAPTAPLGSRGSSTSSSTMTMTQPPPLVPAQPPTLQTAAPPPLPRNRSPRSMSLNIASPTTGTNNLGAFGSPSPNSLAANSYDFGASNPSSPTKSPRPPVPPRLTPTSTGDRPMPLSRSITGDRTPPAPLSRSMTGDRASVTSRASTAGTSTPPLSKSALWSSPQHTGTSTNGVPTTNGSGGRALPLSPLATGGEDHLGLGLGISGMTHSPRMYDLVQLNEADEHQPPTDRPLKGRSSTTEAFEAAFPSIDDIEATFPSLDSLEASDAELKLLGANVPSNLPGTSGSTKSSAMGPPPSVGFEFGRNLGSMPGLDGKNSVSPAPRPFPNSIPDLEGTPRPASTPANGRQAIAFGSAAKAQQSSARVERTEPPKADKLPKPDLPITNIVTPLVLKSYLPTALQILVLDVRPRGDFEARRLPAENVVCIEPILLGRKGMSAKELQEALVLSSRAEQILFERRYTFDLVVLCDESSTSFGDPSTPLGVLFRIIYETEFLKPLRRPPAFLQGGIRAWANEVGEFVGSQAKEDVVVAPSSDASKRLSRKPAVSTKPPSHTRMPQDVGLTGSSFGSGAIARTPITYPERAVSPPVSSGTPAHSHRPIEDMMSPPPPASAGYFEHPHHAYSGSVTLSTTRPASIDYPNLIRPPPVAASPAMERVDSRPRIPQPPKPPHIQPNYQVVYWRDEELGMSGLRNMGNTCYMNSILQCLSGTVPFTRFFTDRRWQREVNMMNPLGTRGELAGAFYSLLRDMWQGELPYLTPIPFRKSICQHARQFIGSEQHDAQEFMIFLLDGLHEDLNRIIVKPQFEELTPEREAELERMPKQLAGAYEWARYKRRNDSIVVDYFQGQFCNQMQCLTCGETSTTYNAFLNLSLPIPVTKGVTKISLNECINALVNREVMDNADAWHCPRCKVARRAAKQLTFSRMPPVLVIHLKRFSFKGPFTDKLETLVEFPLKDLDLTKHMPAPLTPNMDKDGLEKFAPGTDPRAQLPPYRYELYGVTNHFGSLSSGHYTAFIKSRGKWMYCDDSRITTADPKEVVGKPAYILFYKRVPPGH